MDTQTLATELAKALEENGSLERIIRKVLAEAGANHQAHSTENNSLSYSLRGDCMSLANKISETHGIEKKTIFGELKKQTGVSQPEASEGQLADRVKILQGWLVTGKIK